MVMSIIYLPANFLVLGMVLCGETLETMKVLNKKILFSEEILSDLFIDGEHCYSSLNHI